MRTLIVFLLCASFARADVWIVAPAGYYVLSLDSQGVPIITPSPNVTGIEHMGVPDGPVDPPPPPNGEDTWGLVELSRQKATEVNDPQTATKLGIAYTETGKKVQEGIIPKEFLEQALDLVFNAAVGGNKQAWLPWKAALHTKYNSINFDSSKDAGQGIIDIGTGAASTSNEANGEFLRLFIEVILPLILEILKLFPGATT